MAGYAAVVFVVLQAADLILPALTHATWPYRVLVLLALAGAPVTAVLTWLYDRTEAGVVRAVPAKQPLRASSKIALALLVVVVIASGWWFGVKRVRSARVDHSLIAVLPFRTTGASPELAFLHEGAVDLLATKIASINEARVIDSQSLISSWRAAGGEDRPLVQSDAMKLTRRLGAGKLLVGEIVGAGRSFVASARLIDAISGRTVARASETGSVDQLTGTFDRLAASVLSLEAGEDEARLQALLTVSSPALRDYLAARAAYRRARFAEAVAGFRSAYERDTTFALAALGALQARGWASVTNFPERDVTRARRIASSGRASLNPLDRVIFDAVVGERYPQRLNTAAKACGAWKRASAMQPRNAELLHWVADCTYHDGPLFGINDHVKQARNEFERSLEADSTFAPTARHLVEITAQLRDTVALRRFAAVESRADTSMETRVVNSWLIAHTKGDTATLSAMIRAFKTYPPESVNRIRNYHLQVGDDVGLGYAAFEAQVDRGTAFNAINRYRIFTRRGQDDKARQLAQDSSRAGVDVFDFEATGMALYGEGDTTVAASFTRDAAEALKTDTASGRRVALACAAAHWGAWHKQDVTAFRRVLEEADQPTSSAQARTNAEHCKAVLGAIESVLAQRPEAKSQAFRLDSLVAEGTAAIFFGSYSHIIASDLLERVGERAAARRALARRTFALTFYPAETTALRRIGRLAALDGDRERAIQAYQQYLAVKDKPARSDRYSAAIRQELQRLLADEPRRR